LRGQTRRKLVESQQLIVQAREILEQARSITGKLPFGQRSRVRPSRLRPFEPPHRSGAG
jgi:hypothetical protein